MGKLFFSSITGIVSIILVTSCASIIHGPTQTVNFASQPTGAKITIDGKDYGNTPRTVDLRRKGRLKGEISTKQSYSVRIELPGYYPYDILIKREMDGWFLGNLLFGGLIGIIIDASNGAMYKLTPDQLIAQLGKSTAMNMNEGEIYIAATLKADPSWEKLGIMEKSE